MHSMSFHLGVSETILFDGWYTTNWQGLVGSMIGILLMAAIYEGLKNYREFLFVSASIAHRADTTKGQESLMFSGMHLYQTVLQIIQIVISYFLMLIFMTYNVWLCIAVTVGGGFGFWLFAWRKAGSDVTECCH